MLDAMPAKKILLCGWGEEHVDKQFDRPTIKYTSLMHAKERVLAAAFAGREPKDDDLAVLVLRDTVEKTFSRYLTWHPVHPDVPGWLSVDGSGYWISKCVTSRDEVRRSVVDALRGYDGKLSDDASKWCRFLREPSRKVADLLALWMLSESGIEWSAYAVRRVGEELYDFVMSVSVDELVREAKQPRPPLD